MFFRTIIVRCVNFCPISVLFNQWMKCFENPCYIDFSMLKDHDFKQIGGRTWREIPIPSLNLYILTWPVFVLSLLTFGV